MKVVITGGAGFIGSSLADRYAAHGDEVHIIDNFSTGWRQNLSHFTGLVHAVDLTDPAVALEGLIDGAELIIHLAANADVRFGWDDTRRDLTQNVIATLRLAEASASVGVPHVVFASTGSVYGEATVVPTPEDAPFPRQTSLYGASKLSAEGYLAAFAERGSFRVTVLRLVSVLGPRYSHGHVIDFVKQLTAHPGFLDVLGDGSQRKSYLHVDDCVRAFHHFAQRGTGPSFDVFNLGTPEICTVRDSVSWITRRLGLSPEVRYGDGSRGWIGDNPLIMLDVSQAVAAGWTPVRGIRESVESTVDWLIDNPWVWQSGSREA